MLSYGAGFLGFSDSGSYAQAAEGLGSLFGPRKPAGYPIFMKALHVFSNRLTVTILVQHALGIVAGAMLYAAVRRSGAPPYLGLVPAAIVFFGGTGLLLEHSLLADSLFAFAQAAGLYAVVRALREESLRWPFLAGALIGVSFWIKTTGISSAVLVPPLLLLAAPGMLRRRAVAAGAAAAAAVVFVIGYSVVQAALTGYLGYERQGAWNLYGRVATFVDCSHFTPPRGTAFLCPTEPLGQRRPPAYFQYERTSPAVQRFGRPGEASAHANAALQRFSIAAMVNEPIAYAETILRGLTFFVSPRGGEGYTPQSLREELLDRGGAFSVTRRAITRYYPHAKAAGASGSVRSLVRYESHTRVEGPFLVVLVALSVLGAALLRGPARWATVLFTLTAIFSAAFAVAGNSYDARYAYPTFGPIAAAAAIGAWGTVIWVAGQVRSRRDRRSAAPAPD